MIWHYWYVKDIGYEFELHVCNKCHDISMIAYELENIATVNAKGVYYRYVLWNITKNDAINMLGNSKLDDKSTFWIWVLVQIKHSSKKLKKVYLEEHILETFVLVLTVNGTISHGKNLMG